MSCGIWKSVVSREEYLSRFRREMDSLSNKWIGSEMMDCFFSLN
jgi:hypothetical protein